MSNKIFCIDCNKVTKHIPKLSAMLENSMVCDKCRKINTFCTLKKSDNEMFYKQSEKVIWIEFNEDGTFKEKHDTPEVGRSLIMSPFSAFFTWQTTVITEIVTSKPGYVSFKTENSQYELYCSPFSEM